MRENVDLVRLAALNEYWAGHPPVHIMVASYFGVLKTPPKKHTDEDVKELMAMFPMG